jgi:hypothetical protein
MREEGPAHQGLKPLAVNARPPGEDRAGRFRGSGEKSAEGSSGAVGDGSAAQADP